MKKILAVLMSLIVMCATFTACAGSSPSSRPSSTPSSSPSSTPAAPSSAADDEDEDYDYYDEEEYLDEMNGFVDSFESLCGGIWDLLDVAEYISTDEDLVMWAQAFVEAKESIGYAADELAGMMSMVPEDYQEFHVNITIAVAAVYDAMTGFEDAVDAVVNGDEEAFEEGVAVFVGNMLAADELWSEAVE